MLLHGGAASVVQVEKVWWQSNNYLMQKWCCEILWCVCFRWPKKTKKNTSLFFCLYSHSELLTIRCPTQQTCEKHWKFGRSLRVRLLATWIVFRQMKLQFKKKIWILFEQSDSLEML